MFSLTGTVLNCYSVPGSEKFPETKYNVQILGEEATKDGQTKNGMVTFAVGFDCFQKLNDLIGEKVTIPIGIFVSAGRLQPFFPKSYGADVITSPGLS